MCLQLEFVKYFLCLSGQTTSKAYEKFSSVYKQDWRSISTSLRIRGNVFAFCYVKNCLGNKDLSSSPASKQPSQSDHKAQKLRDKTAPRRFFASCSVI